MERKKAGPKSAPEDGAIDLSQIDDGVSVLVRNRATSKKAPEKPGSRLTAFLRATKPANPPAPKSKSPSNPTKLSAAEQQGPAPANSQPAASADLAPPAREAIPANLAPPNSAQQASPRAEAPAKQWPPSRPEPAAQSKSEAPFENTQAAPEPAKSSTPPASEPPPAKVAAEAEEAPKKLWPPSREAAPTPAASNPKLDPPATQKSSSQSDEQVVPASQIEQAGAQSKIESAASTPKPNAAATSQIEQASSPSAAQPSSSSAPTDAKSPSLADYVPPGLRKPVEQGSSSAPSWPPPREAAQGPKTDLEQVPEDLPALARGPIKGAKPAAKVRPQAPAKPKDLGSRASALRDKLKKPLAALLQRSAAQSQAKRESAAAAEAPSAPDPSQSVTAPETTPGDEPQAPSRVPAPSVRTYPVLPVEPPPAQAPPANPPTSQRPPQAAAPMAKGTLANPIPAQVPAAFVRTKPSTPETKAPDLETFKRRQTPQQPRRRKQHSYRHNEPVPEGTVGLRWWYHHLSAVTWLGRSLWIGAFFCAWVALSRCLDPAASDPELSQVPYLALFGWLLCAGLAFNPKIPGRFRWTGLVLGAANSIALALSWSFRLHQL